MSLSKQSIALVMTTKNKETKCYICQKHRRKPVLANKKKQINPWSGTPFTTSS